MSDPQEAATPKLLPEQVRCPKCGQGFWVKLPFNSVDECMMCRWHRLHPNGSEAATPSDPHSAELIATLRREAALWDAEGPTPQKFLTAAEALEARDAEVAELKAKIAESQEIVAELLDPDPCNWDHNHSCQAHGWFFIPQGEMCPNERGRQYVAASSPVEGHDSTCDGLEGCPNPAAHSVEGGN